MKNFYFLLLLSFNSYSQHRLDVLMAINNKIVTSTDITQSFLVIQNDTIDLKYEMGRFDISEKNYNILNKKNTEDIKLIVEYADFDDNYIRKKVQIDLKLEFLLQRYFFLKIYDFSRFPKHFLEKSGYGFEYTSPIQTKNLIKRKKMTLVW